MDSSSNIKHVVYIVSTLSHTGPSNQLFNLVKYLDKMQWKVTIITLSPEPKHSLIHKFTKLDINVMSLDLSRLQGAFSAKSRISQLLSELRPDLIHTQGIRADTLVAKLGYFDRWTLTARNVPVEDYPMKYGKLRGGLMAYMHVKALKKCSNVVSCSSSIHSKLKSICVRSVVIRNGVDYLKVGNSKPDIFETVKKPVFITVGSLIGRKNVELLIRIFSNVEKAALGTLIVVGDGPERENLKSLSSSNTIFTGQVVNVADYLANSDFFVSASLSEGMPNAALEALRCGLPCFLSKIPSHKELRDIVPKSAVLFDLDATSSNLCDFFGRYSELFSSDASSLARLYAENLLSAKASSLNYQRHYQNILEREDE